MTGVRARWGVMLAAAACLLACGGGGGSSPGGNPNPGGPNPTNDAGAFDGGALQPDGGGGGGGTLTDGGIGGSDGGIDAGTNPCVGFAPGTPTTALSFKEPVANYRTNHFACSAGTSDGLGNVDLSDNMGQLGSFDYVLSSTGVLQNTYGGLHTDLRGQASGFEGLQGCASCFWLTVLGPTGAELHRGPNQNGSATYSEDPLGGVVVLEQTLPQQVVAFDSAGSVRWTQPIPETFTDSAIRTDREGNTLLLLVGTPLYGSANLEGRWFDHNGNASPTFSAAPASAGSHYELFTRVGSGLYLRRTTGSTSDWMAMFDAGATAAQPAPAWLGARPNSSMHMVRGGHAYGVLKASSSSSTSCEQDVEIVASDGTSCGTAAFTQTLGACTGSDLGVGYDGTVIQSLPASINCDGHGHCLCAWQYWPAFLR